MSKSIPPLLLICEGRRPRLRKTPTDRPKELELHLATARILRRHCRADWLWFHCPNGEVRDPRTAAKLRAMGVRAGVPDIALVPPRGETCWIEFKREGGSLSDAQEQFKMWAIRHGAPYAICHSMQDVLTALHTWGCLESGAAVLLGSFGK